jgi:hypothetical protein
MMFHPIRIAVPALMLLTSAAFAAGQDAQPSSEAAQPVPESATIAAQAPSASSTEASPAVDTSAPSSTDVSPAVSTSERATTSGRRVQNDRLELDTTIVTGNRELPKVLYIVPWKKADLGELPAQPFNTLLDEVLTPVDRDVFRREVTYYGVVSSGGQATPAPSATPGSAGGTPAGGDEK